MYTQTHNLSLKSTNFNMEQPINQIRQWSYKNIFLLGTLDGLVQVSWVLHGHHRIKVPMDDEGGATHIWCFLRKKKVNYQLIY